jgi:ubiquinone/menaquinone biosynthesis C-methylase UbiE
MVTSHPSPWNAPETVAGFARSAPNEVLMRFAERELAASRGRVVADIGCGAGRNAVPLARMGWTVIGTDLSAPMLDAAVRRAREESPDGRTLFAQAPMESLPLRDRSADLIVAHGIWNLAASSAQFRGAVAEAARVARPDAALFVFTFSRHTLAPAAEPVPGEPFVFTQFAGRPQVFLTDAQLVEELARAGFEPDAAVPLTEYNRPAGMLRPTGPVIYEAAFRRRTR